MKHFHCKIDVAPSSQQEDGLLSALDNRLNEKKKHFDLASLVKENIERNIKYNKECKKYKYVK